MTKVFKYHKLNIFIVLFGLLLFHGLNNYFILTKSRYQLDPDSTLYFEFTERVFRELSKIKLNLKSFFDIYSHIYLGQDFKPPLFFITSSPFLLFGIDKSSATMSNLIYFAILLFATYAIGRRLYNYNVGLLAAFLVSMFPTVFALSRVLLVDFSLAAMVTLTFYLFILNRSSSLKFSLLTGMVIGLGALTKQSYFVFLLPILVYFFTQRDNSENKRLLRNFLISISIGLFISAPWYLHNQALNFMTVSYYFLAKENTDPFFYLKSLLNRQLHPVFFLLFLISLGFCYRNKKYFLPTMTITLLLLFSLSPNKRDRFILPIFPYIAIMMSGFIWSLAKMRKTFIAILILFSFLQFLIICYGNFLSISKFNLIGGLLSTSDHQSGLFTIIDQGNWQSPAREIVKIINDNGKENVNKEEDSSVLLISDRWQILTSIDYQRIIERIPFKLHYPFLDRDFFSPLKSSPEYSDFDNTVIRSDFIILEKVSSENEFVTMTFHARKLFNSFNHNLDKFSFIKAVSFPDNILCYLYKRNEYRN